MKVFKIGLFILAMSSMLLQSVELQRGQQYSGPVKLTAQSLGVGMGISSGWSAFLPKKGGLEVDSADKRMQITMRSRAFNKEDAIKFLTFPVEHEEQLLFPSERIIELTPTKLRRHFRISGKEGEAYIYVVLGPQDRAVVMTGMAPTELIDNLQSEMFSIANTITFTQIKPLMDDSNPLKRRLSGGHFVYYESVGQFNEKREVWLCSNGQFVMRAHQYVGTAGTREIYEYRGSWTVDEMVLKFNMKDGSQKKVYLREEGSAIFFNEKRCYKLRNRVCK